MMNVNILRALHRWHNALAIMFWINQVTLCQEMDLDPAQDSDEGCPSFHLTSVCPCYPFEEGLHIECPYADVSTVQTVVSKLNKTVFSFTIYDLDKSVDVLSKELFVQPNLTSKTVVLKKLYITLSHIKDVDESFVDLLQNHLKEMNIVTSKLPAIPKEINRLLNLNQINFESSFVTEVSDNAFANLRFLQTIILKDNLISKLSENAFYGLENCLLHLDLSENKLNAFPILPLRRLESLSTLKLSFNEISSIIDKTLDLENFKLINLKQLDLSSNNIKFLGKDEFRYFIKLQILSIYQNLIESIHGEAFKSLTELTSLDLSHNNIIFLDSDVFKYNKKLKVVDLSWNHLYNLDRIFSNLINLQELYLSDNNIIEIGDETFTFCSSLNVLHLETNAIQEVHEDSFKNLYNLTQIYLQNNHIKVLKRNLFNSNINLDTLSLNDNLINHIDLHVFKNSEDLRELRLSNNKLKQIKKGHFEELPSLVELYLENNLIESIERGSFGTLEKLQHINLQKNKLKRFENVFALATGNLSLTTLQLDSNSISNLKNNSFHLLVNLQSLHLTDNDLHEVNENIFRSLSQLKQLCITNDNLREIHPGAFRHLKTLSLLNVSNNQLTHLKKSIFKNLSNLKDLYLSKNLITFIEKHCFEDLVSLKILDLSNNPLNSIQSDVFTFLNLVDLNLRNCSIASFENNSMISLEKLEELNLEMNKFPAEGLRTFSIPNLKELKLSHNLFYDIPEYTFSNFKYLQILSLRHCKISSISDEAIRSPTLLKLHLDRNELRGLPDKVFKDVSSLKELYLNDNLLKSVPEKAFEGLNHLETLELNNNSLKYFSFNQIPFLSKLHKISLRQNLISEVQVAPNRSNLPFLFEINLSSNNLNFLPPNFFNSLNSSVRILNLSFNKFANLSNLRLGSALNLKLLNLTGNPLQLIGDAHTSAGKPRNFKESCDENTSKEYNLTIEELVLQRTNLSIITSSDFCSYFNLLHLTLSRNRIQRISPGAFKNLARLLSLDIGNNRIDFIPKERFYGLADLKLLNATQNLIGRLDEFPKNLRNLETLDLSYNKIEKISENAFNNLDNLNELYLYGNWISAISPDAFWPPKKLKLLDISRNNLQNLPLNALEPLESQIRSLKIEENPLHCGCETQRLWEWLREHEKISEVSNLRCSEPPELKGQALMEVSPPRLCQAPAVRKLTINDVRPKSVLVTWQSSPHTKVYGYRVTYQSIYSADIGKILDQNTRSARLTNLKSNTRYTICVYGLNSWEAETVLGSASYFKTAKLASSAETENQSGVSNSTDLQSMCTEVTTTVDEDNEILAMDHNRYKEGSILTRRLGLIIGSCMGFVVFIILVSILGYLKIKKQRATAKRDPPLPPEYLSYRHFSIQGAENLQAHISQGTTTLNA